MRGKNQDRPAPQSVEEIQLSLLLRKGQWIVEASSYTTQSQSLRGITQRSTRQLSSKLQWSNSCRRTIRCKLRSSRQEEETISEWKSSRCNILANYREGSRLLFITSTLNPSSVWSYLLWVVSEMRVSCWLNQQTQITMISSWILSMRSSRRDCVVTDWPNASERLACLYPWINILACGINRSHSTQTNFWQVEERLRSEKQTRKL